MKRTVWVAIIVVVAVVCAVGAVGVLHARQEAGHHVVSTCLLPTFDEGYLQNPGATATVLCVNTGKPATKAQIAAANYAGQCQDGGYVACYHPCYAYSSTPGVPYPYAPVPCPGDKVSR